MLCSNMSTKGVCVCVSVYYPFSFKLTESSMSIDKGEPMLYLKAQLDASVMTDCLYVVVEDCYETALAAQ